ncbi:MAG: hypothetical protein PWR27_2465 [Petroclostridium sp.]|nr:hypothetical protein [Petroclostridium sp.]
MENLLFYSFILLVSILATLLLAKRGSVLLGIILLIEYFVISLFSIIIIKDKLMNFPDITLLPFIILLISYFIAFSPFFSSKNNFNADKIDITYYKVYNYMIYLYIIFSFITIMVYLPNVLDLIQSDNWAVSRQLYYDGLTTNVYENTIERISLNYVSYFRTFSILVYFIFLKYDYNPKLRTALLISIILTIFLASIQNVSRGMIFDFFLLFTAMYMFFRSALKKEIRKRLNIFMSTTAGIFLVYSMVVTISRFSNSGVLDSSSMNSLIEYFGQAPLVFNYGVFPIFTHTSGVYSFGKLFDLFLTNLEFSQSSIGGKWGSGFYTYVGPIYIDFGILGVIIHSLLICFVLTYLLSYKRFKISTIFLIFTIYEYLLRGALVIGRSYIISLVVNVLVYIFIYSQEKIKINSSKKPYLDLSSNHKKKYKF